MAGDDYGEGKCSMLNFQHSMLNENAEHLLHEVLFSEKLLESLTLHFY